MSPSAAGCFAQPFVAGQPLGVTLQGTYTPMSSNVKVYGAVVNAESCSYDAVRGLIVVPNRGAEQNQIPNDGFVSLLNHDGSVHTAKWIGVNRNGLILNHPLGSDIVNGILYLVDRDGGTTATEPTVSVIRKFDMATGAPAGELRQPQSPGLNDIAVTADGTIYGTQTRIPGQPAELIASGIPSPASMCYDAGANQLVIPMNLNNGVALIPLR